MFAAALGGAAILAATALAAPVANAAVTLISSPASYVNTLAGTGSGGSVVGSINNFPGAAVPFGMMQFSPTNPGRGQGYYYDNNDLRGFGLNSASQGCGAFGDFPILPSTLSVASGQKPWEKTNSYSHTGEVGEPGYYKLISKDTNNVTITSELTATTRTGVATFTFPAGTNAPKVFFRSGVSNTGATKSGAININPTSGNVTGWTKSGNFCGKSNSYQAYFAASFEQDFSSYGVWNESTGAITAGSGSGDAEVSNVKAGGYVQFPDGTTEVRLRIALSYTGTDNAIENMETEVPTVNASAFNAVRADSVAQWNDRLSMIQISDDGDDDRTRTFYTSLYRTLLHPNVFDDVNGDYLGFETNPQVHNVADTTGLPTGVTQEHQYANISDWDTYRSLAPLQSLLYPKEASDLAQSLVNDADQAGSFPRWAFLNASTNQMSGDNASALIAQTYAFQARDFNVQGSLDHMVEGAVGETAGTYTGGTTLNAITRPGAKIYNELKYGPQIKEFQTDHAVTGASVTQEWSVDDFAIGQLAGALGHDDLAAQFQLRSHYWQNLFNPTTNYISPRDAAGRFPDGNGLDIPNDFGYRGHVTGYGTVGYDEGNAEQYVWFVPQNIAGLTTALGGREATADRLNTFMTNGLNVGANRPYMNAGNEPNFQTPWLYNYLGQPWRTVEVVDEMRDNLFGPNPHGAEPGNDDLGAMSSWYVWAALGVYPTTPGTDILTVNSPLFDMAVLHLGNGKTMTITADGASLGKTYIQALSVDGAPTTKTYLPDGILTQNSNIEFTLGDNPSTTWGTAVSDAPPSFEDGSNGVAANISPNSTQLQAGGNATLTLDIQQLASTAPRFTVRPLDVPTGIDLPAVASTAFDGYGHATLPLPVSVAPTVPAGYYNIDVEISSGTDTTTAVARIKVARANSLFSAWSLIGTSPEDAASGNFDGVGNSYSRDQLAILGLAPGAVRPLTNGTTLVWPNVPVGEPETVLPSGQKIILDRPASTISFVGAGTDGGGQNTATVTFDNGTSVNTADFSFGDWVKPSQNGSMSNGTLAPVFGNTVVAWTPTRNANSSDVGAYVFATKPFTAPAGRKITSVTLPTTSDARLFTIAQDAPSLTASPSTVAAGTALALTGAGFGASESVSVTVGGSTQQVTTDALGNLAGSVTVPAATPAGSLTISAAGPSFPGATTTTVTVTASATPGDGDGDGDDDGGTQSGHVTLAAAPLSSLYGTAVTLNASVSGPTTGAVTFYEGTRLVGSATVTNGAARLVVTGLNAGEHVFHATVAGATAAQPVTVTVTKTTLKKLKVSGKKFAKGTKPKVAVKMTKLTNGARATNGKITLHVGKKAVKTVKVKKFKGKKKLTVKLPKKYRKAIKVSASYKPGDTTNIAPLTSAKVKLKLR